MRSYLFSLLACLMLSSCSEQVDGGDCAYDTHIIPAQVTSIIPLDSPWYDLELVLLKDSSVKSDVSDTISYIQETKDYLTAARIKDSGIVVGNKYKYKVMDRTRGHCTPHITVLKLEPF